MKTVCRAWALMMGKYGTIFGVQCPEIVNGAMTEKAGYIVALKRDMGQLLWDHVMEQRFPTNSVTPYFGAGDEEGNLILETGGGVVSVGPVGVNWSFQNIYPAGIEVMQAGLTLDASGNVYALVRPSVSISGPSLSLLCLDRNGNLLWRQDNAVQGGAIWMNLQMLPGGKLYGVNFYDIYAWDEQQKLLVQIKQPSTELLDALDRPRFSRGWSRSGGYRSYSFFIKKLRPCRRRPAKRDRRDQRSCYGKRHRRISDARAA
ncbi:hypothetical protein ACFFNY_32250 [Paenibacillus hodogayensis]|uniref:PQQ-binding-like beta-propeller repeat protein n=1 Tax=Paenibacillus hodogayensis TaxID=279208 RepID=A0ABV5W6T3_9BACL